MGGQGQVGGQGQADDPAGPAWTRVWSTHQLSDDTLLVWQCRYRADVAEIDAVALQSRDDDILVVAQGNAGVTLLDSPRHRNVAVGISVPNDETESVWSLAMISATFDAPTLEFTVEVDDMPGSTQEAIELLRKRG